jgi:DNA-binding transcriptional LysR family regulator
MLVDIGRNYGTSLFRGGWEEQHYGRAAAHAAVAQPALSRQIQDLERDRVPLFDRLPEVSD